MESREGKQVERLLAVVAESVLEDDSLVDAMRHAGLDPTEEALRLKEMLLRDVQDFCRFYMRKAVEDVLLTPDQVAARYNLTVEWVYHNKILKKLALKVGKYLRYRESDLARFEQAWRDRPARDQNRGFDITIMRRLSEERNTVHNKTKLQML